MFTSDKTDGDITPLQLSTLANLEVVEKTAGDRLNSHMGAINQINPSIE